MQYLNGTDHDSLPSPQIIAQMETHIVSETILDGSANRASTVPLVSSCLKAFKLLSGVLDDVDIQHQSPLRRAIEECNGRFRVWSGNIGAHQTGKGSLDYRLRNASYIKARVLRLLEDLAELLSDGENMIYTPHRVERDPMGRVSQSLVCSD